MPSLAAADALPAASATGPAPWTHRGPLQVDDDFLVLDDPTELETFTRTLGDEAGTSADLAPGAATLCESSLVVQGMSCAACADVVESALKGQPGVRHARVQAATRRLVLRWDPQATRFSTLARAVGAVGYRLLPAPLAMDATQRLAQTREALWRLFVAGLCAMQIMMYAWPVYVAEPGAMPPDIEQLLRWASWVLSLPVMVFSTGPFFRSAWGDLKARRIGMDAPVALGIAVTFAVSTAATWHPQGPWGHEVWFDSLTMFVFFLLGGRYLEQKARERTAGALDALMDRLPPRCERATECGGFEWVSARRLRAGDVVRVLAGQAFVGDGELLSEVATVDEALLTGESRPLTRRQGEAVVAGSYNRGGPVLVRLSGLGRQTRFAQIVALMERASVDKPRLAQLADRLAAPFLIVVLLGALMAFALGWPEPQRALAAAVAVLIVTCPCALSLATPAAMLAAAGALARGGNLVRRLQAFETLAEVDLVAFDKTGTLTQDRLQLARVDTRDGVSPRQALAAARVLASASLHPLSLAIARAAADQAPDEPLVAASGWTALCEHAGQGIEGTDPQGRRWRLGSAAFCGVTASADRQAFARAHLSDERGWLATFHLQEALRADAAAALQALRAMGLKTALLSGDHEAAAQSVAQALGIDEVHAGCSPEDKLARVARWQAEGRRVLMVGDGINDGPVLARAHASITLGRAAPLAQAQSDLVVQSGRVREVLRALQLARRTMRIVRQNLAWAAAYNAIGVPLAMLGYMPPWLAGIGMASSSLLVIGNAWRLSAAADAGDADAESFAAPARSA